LYQKSRNLLRHISQNVDRGPQIRPTQNFRRGAPYGHYTSKTANIKKGNIAQQ